MKKKNNKFGRISLTLAICAFLGLGATACSTTEADATSPVVEATTPGAKKGKANLSGFAQLLNLKPRTVTVPAGTPISIRTISAISTRSHQAGDAFTATLAEPIIVNGVVLAKKGSPAAGVVTGATDGGRVKGRAAISLVLNSIQFESGSEAVQTTTVGRRAPSTVKKDAVKIGSGAGIGAAIGAIAGGGKGAAIGSAAGGGAATAYTLSTHGAPAVIGAESVLRFKLEQPVEVKEP